MAKKEENKVKYKFGERELDMKNYLDNADHNVQAYIEDRRKNGGWTDDMVQEFSTSYNRQMQALRDQLNGNTNRFYTDAMGTIYDSQGQFSNTDNDDIDPNGSQYYYDSKGNRITTDDYNLLKDKKKSKYKTFQANQQVATYLNRIGRAIKTEEPKAKTKFDNNKHGFVTWWKNTFNQGSDSADLSPYLDLDPFDETTGERPTVKRGERAKEWLGKYLEWVKDQDLDFSDNINFKDYDSFAQAGNELGAKWGDGNWEPDDQIQANRFGIGSDWLNSYFTKSKRPGMTESDIEAAKAEKEAKEKKAKEEEYNSNWKSFVDQLVSSYDSTKNPYNVDNGFEVNINDDFFDEEGELNKENYLKSWGEGFLGSDNKLNTAKVKDYMNQFVQNPFDQQYSNDLGRNILGLINYNIAKPISSGDLQGKYYIPSKSDEQYNRALIYDPETNKLGYAFVGDVPELWEAIRNKHRRDFGGESPNSKYYKEGGILSMQIGGDFGKLLAQDRDTYVNTKAKEAGLTPEEYQSRNRKLFGNKNALEQQNGEWTKYDTARAAATVADITSMVTGFTPATVASVGIGALGTSGHLYADTEDGFDLGDVGRAALGYGLDALSLIPGMAAVTKTAKVVKNVAKLAPKAMLVIGGMHTLANGKEILGSLQKSITSPKEMTTADWQNVAQALTIVTGGVGAGARARAIKTGKSIRGGKTTNALDINDPSLKGNAVAYPGKKFDEGVIQLRRKSTGDVENLVLTADETKAIKGAKNNDEIMKVLTGGKREGMDDYELITSTSIRPRFRWIRANGEWQSPIHFTDKKARPLTLRQNQFTGEQFAESKGWLTPDIQKSKLATQTAGELEESAIKADLAKVRSRSDAYDRILKNKEANMTRYKEQQKGIQDAITNFSTNHKINAGLDLPKLKKIQADISAKEAEFATENSKLHKLRNKKAKKAQRAKVNAIEKEIENLYGQVKKGELRTVRRSKIQDYINELTNLESQSKNINKKITALDKYTDKGHTKEYLDLERRKKGDNIEFNVNGRTVSRKFEDLLKKYNIIYEQGGKFDNVRKFQIGGKTQISNVWASPDVNWFDHMLKTEPMSKWLQTFNPQNAENFNKLQERWEKNLKETGYTPGGSAVLGNDVKARQEEWNKTGTNANIKALHEAGLMRGNGGTNDVESAYADGYFGSQEYLRHGGTRQSWKGHENELAQLQEKFKQRGLNYIDDVEDSDMFYLRPLNPSEQVTTPLNNPTEQGNQQITETTTLGDENTASEQEKTTTPWKENLGNLGNIFNDPKMLSIGRMLLAEDANRTMTRNAIEAARNSLTLMDPRYYTKYLQGDLDALMQGQNNAAQLMSMARRNAEATSDGRLGTAVQLSAMEEAQKQENAGKQADNQAFRKSKEELWQLGKEINDFNYNVAMENRTRIGNLIDNIANLKNAYKAKQFGNIDTFLQELQYDWKQNKNKTDAMKEKYMLIKLQNDAFDNIDEALGNAATEEEKAAWKKARFSGLSPSVVFKDDEAGYNNYISAYQKLQKVIQNNVAKYYGIKFSPYGIRSLQPTTISNMSIQNEDGSIHQNFKDGGTVKAAKVREHSRNKRADADRFYKTTKDKLDRIEKALDRLDKKMYKRREPLKAGK